MAKHVSETPATQWLKHKKVVYSEHPYDYVEHGGTSESSKKLGVPEHAVVKTLVMQDEHGKGLVVLMHGDCKTSTKNLARQIGRKLVEPCTPDVAQKNSGYLVGGLHPLVCASPYPCL
jgi:Cys-tRNA(Pro) deacylase